MQVFLVSAYMIHNIVYIYGILYVRQVSSWERKISRLLVTLIFSAILVRTIFPYDYPLS